MADTYKYLKIQIGLDDLAQKYWAKLNLRQNSVFHLCDVFMCLIAFRLVKLRNYFFNVNNDWIGAFLMTSDS